MVVVVMLQVNKKIKISYYKILLYFYRNNV